MEVEDESASNIQHYGSDGITVAANGFQDVSSDTSRAVQLLHAPVNTNGTQTDTEGIITEGGPDKPPPYTTRQILILLTLCALTTSNRMFYALLAPFFPTEAKNVKGASELEVGLIFSSFSLINFFVRPLFGYYLTSIGSKFMVVTGNFVCSACAILFGVLEWCPPGRIFVIMCFVTRIVESLGGAAQSTATYAIAAHTFPHRIASVMGLLQAAGCIGLMAGPPLGGVLYAVGGYYLPFLVSGGFFMIFSLICIVLLPRSEDTRSEASSLGDKLKMAKIPLVIIIGYLVFSSAFAMGFFDVSLSIHLNNIQPDLTTVYVGLIFLVPAALVVVLAPIIGFLADKYKVLARPFIVGGTFISVAGVLLMGPAPFLNFVPQDAVWVIIVGLVIVSFGWASSVIQYPQFLDAAKRHGLQDNMETQGIIAGLNGAFSSLGAFLGPTLGGIGLQRIGFPMSCTIMAGMIFLGAVLLAIYMVVVATCSPEVDYSMAADKRNSDDVDERAKLLNNRTSIQDTN